MPFELLDAALGHFPARVVVRQPLHGLFVFLEGIGPAGPLVETAGASEGALALGPQFLANPSDGFRQAPHVGVDLQGLLVFLQRAQPVASLIEAVAGVVNRARDVAKGKTLGFGKPDARGDFERMAEKVKEEINKVFNPEFLNRLDDTIVFHALNRDHIAQIVGILARDVQKRLGEEELTLRLTQGATDFLVDHGYDEHFGARPLKRAIQKYVEDPLSEKILVGDFAKGDEIEVDVAPDKERLAFRALSGSKA